MLPEGIEIREARPEDNDGIIAVCRATPIVSGDAKVTIDPSPDYFAYLRLMEGSKSLVAVEGKKVVAVHSASIYTAGYGDRTQRMIQVLHTRVLPEYGGIGLMGFLNEQYGRWSYELNQEIGIKNVKAGKPFLSGEMLAGCGYVAVGNTAVVRDQTAPNAWKLQPFRVTLPCATLAASPERSAYEVRRASADDVAGIVDVLNTMHEKESLYLPYTSQSFTERMTRAADVYSWHDIYLTDGAVLGVWFAHHTRTKVTATATERTVRALALDYGFTHGNEDAFRALLRAAARDGVGNGTTHLSFFTSEPSPGSELLRELGDAEEYYVFGTPFTEEPKDTAQYGMYVDQISF